MYLYLETFSFATGLGTPIRRGLSNISLLRWSTSGDYLLAAKLYGQFLFLTFLVTNISKDLQNSLLY